MSGPGYDPFSVDSIEALDEESVRRVIAEENDLALETKREKTRAMAYGEIRWLVQQLAIEDSIEEQARRIFDQAHDADLLSGRSRRDIAVAAVYATLRCHVPTIPAQSVLPFCPESRRSIRHTYRVLNRELGLPTPPPDPIDYIDRFADAMECNDEIRERTVEIVGLVKERTKDRALHPAAVTAASLYAAAEEHGRTLDQSELAELAGASLETVNAIHRTEVTDALASENE